ncbi:MAG: C40 family peptidase [Lautropia sp.]|nr:C40 family peptidase [Lautropia sp.]
MTVKLMPMMEGSRLCIRPLRPMRRAALLRLRTSLRGMAACAMADAVLSLTACASLPPPPLAREEANEITLQALALVGTPYRWGGNRPEEGFDCSGLVQHVYREALGIELPRTSRAMGKQGTRIDRAGLAPGDLVFFQTGRHPDSHVGIYIGRGRFVHAPSSGSLVRVEALDKRYWQRRFNGGRRLHGV